MQDIKITQTLIEIRKESINKPNMLHAFLSNCKGKKAIIISEEEVKNRSKNERLEFIA